MMLAGSNLIFPSAFVVAAISGHTRTILAILVKMSSILSLFYFHHPSFGILSLLQFPAVLFQKSISLLSTVLSLFSFIDHIYVFTIEQ